MSDKKPSRGRGRGRKDVPKQNLSNDGPGTQQVKSEKIENITTDVRPPKQEGHTELANCTVNGEASPPLVNDCQETQTSSIEDSPEVSPIKDSTQLNNEHLTQANGDLSQDKEHTSEPRDEQKTSNDLLSTSSGLTGDLEQSSTVEQEVKPGDQSQGDLEQSSSVEQEVKPEDESQGDLEQSSSIEQEVKPEDKSQGDGEQARNAEPEVIPEDEPPVLESILSPLAPEFVPFAFLRTVEDDDIDNVDDVSPKRKAKEERWEDLVPELTENLKYIFDSLTLNPGQFDTIVEMGKSLWKVFLQFPELRTQIVEKLLEFTMLDKAFAYNAVKILLVMLEISRSLGKDIDMRSELLNFARHELNCTRDLILPHDIHFPFLNLTMFVSELYIQLEVANARLVFIGEAVMDFIKCMLFTETLPLKIRLENAKDIIKLVGPFIDQDNKSLLDSVVTDLQLIVNANRANLPASTIEMVYNLIATRKIENWSQTPSDEETSESVESQNLPDKDYEEEYDFFHPVFYGPDGSVLQFEEQQFLEYEVEIADARRLSPSFDPEFEQAYEEFLLSLPDPRLM